jgi:uncharacterized protein (TIGR00255 family)
MLSMTGFGNGEAQSGPVTVTAELRSVNHRFLDVSLKLPGLLAAYEADVRKFLKDNIARGRVTVSLQATVAQEQAGPRFDPARLAQGLQMVQAAAAAMEQATGQPQKVTLDHLLRVPDLFRTEEPELAAEDVRAALLGALAAACQGLQAMKDAEGRALVDEMNERLDTLETSLAEVEKLAPQAAAEIHRKLNDRLEKLLGDQQLDPQRLAQEVALLADKANINEECERLGIHIRHYRAALAEGGQVAKRLNFLLQEMHREVNTMGSKTNLMDITQAVIAMKDEVESLREQIQNLE